MTTPFPTVDDFKRIGPTFPDEPLTLRPEDIYQRFSKDHSLTQISRVGDILTWVNTFNGRVYHARKSYIFMSFYIEKGIPEDIDIGQYTNEQHDIKDYFDYFADIFFYKIFSAWDTIGQIINLVSHLDLDRPSFEGAINKLKKSGEVIYHLYEPIITSMDYEKAKKFRNDITHNVPPGVIDQRPVQVTPIITYFGVSKRILSSDVFSTANNAIPLLAKTVSSLKEQIAS